MIAFFQLCWRIWKLHDSRLWITAENAVRTIMDDRRLNLAAQTEPMTSFCPRCGQRPDGDRRMEEARELAMTVLKDAQVVRRDLDFALSFHYWWKRL